MNAEDIFWAFGEISDKFLCDAVKPAKTGHRLRWPVVMAAVAILGIMTFATALAVDEDFRDDVFTLLTGASVNNDSVHDRLDREDGPAGTYAADGSDSRGEYEIMAGGVSAEHYRVLGAFSVGRGFVYFTDKNEWWVATGVWTPQNGELTRSRDWHRASVPIAGENGTVKAEFDWCEHEGNIAVDIRTEEGEPYGDFIVRNLGNRLLVCPRNYRGASIFEPETGKVTDVFHKANFDLYAGGPETGEYFNGNSLVDCRVNSDASVVLLAYYEYGPELRPTTRWYLADMKNGEFISLDKLSDREPERCWFAGDGTVICSDQKDVWALEPGTWRRRELLRDAELLDCDFLREDVGNGGITLIGNSKYAVRTGKDLKFSVVDLMTGSETALPVDAGFEPRSVRIYGNEKGDKVFVELGVNGEEAAGVRSYAVVVDLESHTARTLTRDGAESFGGWLDWFTDDELFSTEFDPGGEAGWVNVYHLK